MKETRTWKWIGEIADYPTPKHTRGGVSFTINERDYKGVMVVIYEERKDMGCKGKR